MSPGAEKNPLSETSMLIYFVLTAPGTKKLPKCAGGGESQAWESCFSEKFARGYLNKTSRFYTGECGLCGHSCRDLPATPWMVRWPLRVAFMTLLPQSIIVIQNWRFSEKGTPPK